MRLGEYVTDEQGKNTGQRGSSEKPPDDASPPKSAVDAAGAVVIAREFVHSVYGGTGDVAVEEIDFDQQQGDWLITVGFWRSPPTNPGNFVMLQAPSFERVYKVVRVKQSTGAPLSMKIRSLEE